MLRKPNFKFHAKVKLDYDYLNPILSRYNEGDDKMGPYVLDQFLTVVRMLIDKRFGKNPERFRKEIYDELLIEAWKLIRRRVITPQPGMTNFLIRNFQFALRRVLSERREHVWAATVVLPHDILGLAVKNAYQIKSYAVEYIEWKQSLSQLNWHLWQLRYMFRWHGQVERYALEYILAFRIALGVVPPAYYIALRFRVGTARSRFLVDQVAIKYNMALRSLWEQGMSVSEDWKFDDALRVAIRRGHITGIISSRLVEL